MSNLTIGLKFDGSSMERALEKLSEVVGEQVLRSAGFAGAEVFRNEVIQRAPKGKTGRLSQNIAIVRAKEKSDTNKRQVYRIRVKQITKQHADTRANRRKNIVGKRYQVDGPAFYWRFLEFGTSKMAARPFIRPAFDSRVNDALKAVMERMRVRIAENLRSTK